MIQLRRITSLWCNLLYAVVFISLAQLVGCSDPLKSSEKKADSPAEGIKREGNRLAFSSHDEFSNTVKKLDNLHGKEFEKWQNDLRFKSLASMPYDTLQIVEDMSMRDNLPASYRSLLNEEGEVIINDSIRWWTPEGRIYSVPKGNEEKLKAIKSNPPEGKFETFNVSACQSPTAAGRIFLWLDGLDARHQSKFAFGATHKHVAEVYTVAEHGRLAVYFRTKIEYLSCRTFGWFSCSEVWRRSFLEKTLSYRISGYARAGNSSRIPFQFSENDIKFSCDYNQRLAYFTGRDQNTLFEIEISGAITQAVSSYSYTSRSFSGNPLW